MLLQSCRRVIDHRELPLKFLIVKVLLLGRGWLLLLGRGWLLLLSRGWLLLLGRGWLLLLLLGSILLLQWRLLLHT